MKKLINITTLIVLFYMQNTIAVAQCTAPPITPTTTSSCTLFGTYTTFSGSSACSGSGFGGGGSAKVIPICTNSNGDCMVLEASGLPGNGGVSFELYSTCTGTASLSGYVSGSVACYSDATDFAWSSSDLALAPNTCYYAVIWSKNGFPFTSTFCTYTEVPPNDECTGATAIDATPYNTENYCMTAGATDPPPADFCAGTLENTAWYTFTVSADGDVIITIDNIACYGGGLGFQIGFFSGTCGSLTSDGCSSGSGGTVTATYAAQTAGTVLYVGLDGNAGSNCNFDISASNTVVLPVKLLNLNAVYNSDKDVVDISWSTLSEENNDYFTIEKSIDGVNFKSIGKVEGNGNSSSLIEYSFRDVSPSNNQVVYYKILQTDFNGKTTQSGLVSVKTKLIEEVKLIENPIINNAELNIESLSNQNISINVYNMTGNIVGTYNQELYKGSNYVSVDLNNLSEGLYMLHIIDKNNRIIEQIKFVKG
jgi:hypothetical protein